MSAIRGVLFDKDGTLFDFGTTWEAWAKASLTRLGGGDAARAVRLGQAVGFDYDARRFDPGSVVIAGTPLEVVAALAPHLPEYDSDALFDILNEEAARTPQAEVTDLVAYLQSLRDIGLALGVATNDAEAPARAHLDGAGITGLLDFIAGCDSGYGAKPTPGQMQGFMAVTGLPAHAVVMVGDSTHDLRAGRAAGMSCVGVLTGMASADVLAPYADAVLTDITALPDWISTQV